MIVPPLLHNLLLGKSMIPIDLKTGCPVASVSLGQNGLIYLLELAPKRHQHQSSVNTHICFPLPAVVQYFGCNEGGEVTHTVCMTLRKDLWWCLLLAVSKRERFQNVKRFISEHWPAPGTSEASWHFWKTFSSFNLCHSTCLLWWPLWLAPRPNLVSSSTDLNNSFIECPLQPTSRVPKFENIAPWKRIQWIIMSQLFSSTIPAQRVASNDRGQGQVKVLLGESCGRWAVQKKHWQVQQI